jgi:hypothetical protein
VHATGTDTALLRSADEVTSYADDWAGLQRVRVLHEGPVAVRVSAPAGVLRRHGRVQVVRDDGTGLVAEVLDLQRIGGADLAELRRVHGYDLRAPRLQLAPIGAGATVIVGLGADAIRVELPVRVLEAADGALVFVAHDGFEAGDRLLLRDADVELQVVVLHAVPRTPGQACYGGRITGIDPLVRR